MLCPLIEQVFEKRVLRLIHKVALLRVGGFMASSLAGLERGEPGSTRLREQGVDAKAGQAAEALVVGTE